MKFLLPRSAADRARQAAGSSGYFNIRHDPAEGLVVIISLTADQVGLPVQAGWLDQHYMRAHSSLTGRGKWYLVEIRLHDVGRELTIRGGTVPTDQFRDLVLGGWDFPPPNSGWPVLTVAARDGVDEWRAWWVGQEHSRMMDLEVVENATDILSPLDPGWPRAELAGANVAVIGVGSVGSAAAVELARYGVTQMTLVDSQRLENRNFARHQVHPRMLGRWKTRAVADLITDWNPRAEITPLELNVLVNTDAVRPVVRDADVAVVATDGVATRRVLNHAAAWARTPSVFAAVLENGAIGEVLRVLPGRTGCLTCHRDELYESGGLDPEPGIDSGYEAEGGARPMTAVGGDLALVGAVAAKLAVATILERAGYREANVPGDHLSIALRPSPDLLAPFDLERTLQVKWSVLPEPRADCPTCTAFPA